jgi:hypothetical protein
MTRALAQTIAKVLAAALVCAQLLVAAYACPWLTSGIVSSVDTAAGGLAQPPDSTPACHQTAPTSDSGPSNLCAEHCKYGQQSDHCTVLDVPAATLSPLYATFSPTDDAPRPCLTAWLSALVAASPPHAIAHCVWRI